MNRQQRLCWGRGVDSIYTQDVLAGSVSLARIVRVDDTLQQELG